jgi:hypothetical protein
MKLLKIINLFVLVLATAAFSFGAWGLYTDAGRKEYRELAYIIPDLSMKAGLVLFAVYLLLLAIITVLKRKSKPQEPNQ